MTDWRLYEMLSKTECRPGDEPMIRNKITIKYGDREVVVPLPSEAEVLELQELREEMADEMDRIVFDWHEKVTELEQKLRIRETE